MKFLEAVAKRYVDYGPLDRVCFVFPNRRSGTFFKRYLGIKAGHPVFVPHVLTSCFPGLPARRRQRRSRVCYLSCTKNTYV